MSKWKIYNNEYQKFYKAETNINRVGGILWQKIIKEIVSATE